MPLFAGSSPFDSDVERATSELNTKEDHQLIREISNRASQSSAAARDCLRSIAKRLNHKDPHVALQTLQLLEQCSAFAGLAFRQEVASRDFISECRTLITNGKTHTKVIRRLKQLIRQWSEGDYKSDTSLSNIPSLFNSLRTEGHTFPIDDEMIKDSTTQQEEDDLAKAIALSLEQSSGKQSSTSRSLYPSVATSVTREARKVQALYDFEAAEDNEITFKAGEILSVLDDSDPNWWKGSSWRGEGLFPANFVTADLTAEIEPDIPKNRKSVRFQEEVDVQVLESAPVEVIEVDENKIDETLSLIQNADPTGDNDSPQLLALEDQCRSMGPLIDQELETIDRQHNTLVEVNVKLMEAFQMYHSLMQGLPNYGYALPQTQQQMAAASSQNMATQGYTQQPPGLVTAQMYAPQQFLPQSVGASQYAAPPQSGYQSTTGAPVYQQQAQVYTTQTNSLPAQSNVYSTPQPQQQLATGYNNASHQSPLHQPSATAQFQHDLANAANHSGSPQHVYQPVYQAPVAGMVPGAPPGMVAGMVEQQGFNAPVVQNIL